MPANLFFSTPVLPKPPSFLSQFNPSSHSSISISSSLYSNPPKSLKPNHPINPQNPEFKSSFDPISALNAAVKVPTPPWMTGPLLLQPHEVLDLSKPRIKKSNNNGKPDKSDRALTGKESGVRGKKAIRKIVQSLDMLRELGNSEENKETSEEIEFGVCLEKLRGDGDSKFGGKMPWSRDERVVFRRMKKEKVASVTELRIDKVLLERLRGEAAKMRKWVKVKKAGVTQAVVDEIRLIWRHNELAMLKFDVPLCLNMERAQEIVETKTEGLTVWSKKDTLVIYRGSNYQFKSRTLKPGFVGSDESHSSKLSQLQTDNLVKSNENVDENFGKRNGDGRTVPTGLLVGENLNCQPVDGSLFERETDRLLDGLGPRFCDWWMRKPLPVDADLLPEVVPGYRPPYRLCPPHAKPKLTDTELTYLRKLAQPLPTHFVLGRNRKLQGLAAAILKLWKKSYIVKIAVKWGVENTNNEQMAYELKYLTGGILLLRNKFYIILYRGKDFVPCNVADLIAEREMELQRCQLQEENARLKAAETFCTADELLASNSTIGTLSDFQDIQSEFGGLNKINNVVDVKLEVEKEQLERELREQERKLFILNKKIERSTKVLSKLNAAWSPSKDDADQEMMTEEERECFRKIGLKMHRCLVLGRRGVFDGVIEGVRQHWKHREVVKVITMQKLFVQVIYTATLLQAECGGVLVSVDKLKEGHAIIIYRGKNYGRPLNPGSRDLLTKREALHRSLELQRIGSLKVFAHQRQKAISKLKLSLANLRKSGETEQRESEVAHSTS